MRGGRDTGTMGSSPTAYTTTPTPGNLSPCFRAQRWPSRRQHGRHGDGCPRSRVVMVQAMHACSGPVCGRPRHGGTRGRAHLEQQVVFQDPLHGHHQQVLQLELALLDLERALLVGESGGR